MPHAATLKTLALTCLIGGPVMHGLLGPVVGAAFVGVGLATYLLGLILALRVAGRAARGIAALSLGVGGWFLLSWAWVRFGPARIDSVPLGVDPWVGHAAIAIEIAALYAALEEAPKIWVWVLAAIWALSWPPINRLLFLLTPQVAVLLPSFIAIAAMLVLSQQSRLARADR